MGRATHDTFAYRLTACRCPGGESVTEMEARVDGVIQKVGSLISILEVRWSSRRLLRFGKSTRNT